MANFSLDAVTIIAITLIIELASDVVFYQDQRVEEELEMTDVWI